MWTGQCSSVNNWYFFKKGFLKTWKKKEKNEATSYVSKKGVNVITETCIMWTGQCSSVNNWYFFKKGFLKTWKKKRKKWSYFIC